MNVVPPYRAGRGLVLLAAHCQSLDPDAPSARDRLTEAIGVELAAKLVLALSSGPPGERFAA